MEQWHREKDGKTEKEDESSSNHRKKAFDSSPRRCYQLQEELDYTRILLNLYSLEFPFSAGDYSSILRLNLSGEG